MECGRLPSASPTFIPFTTDMQPKEPALRGTHVLTCVWDFDKTLCPGYMQTPLFKAFGVDEEQFWKETNQLPALYARKGIRTPKDSVYLNHLLSYVKSGLMKGLTNARLRELGADIELCPGLPQFFPALKEHVRELGRKHNVEVVLEHYVISTGLAEMIRGTSLVAHCDGIYGCEFLEHPLPPHFTKQDELSLDLPTEITQACLDYALRAHHALGCRGVSRTDFRWDAARGLDGLILLETNTQPGMTPTSLSPEQAAHVGISFPELCRWIVEDASCNR